MAEDPVRGVCAEEVTGFHEGWGYSGFLEFEDPGLE